MKLDRYIAPKKVLKGANKTGLEDVLVIGYEQDGGKLYIASSEGDVDRLRKMLSDADYFISLNSVEA